MEMLRRLQRRINLLIWSSQQEGKYEYREGDTIGDLIALAKGLRVDSPFGA